MKRILFVDDEPRVLDGLQRMLRAHRNRWHMAFATSALEALSILESEAFDIVVTDMRMPGMDGAELLTQVQQRFPAVIRVVLTGYVERDAALRAAPVAHQFLTKPCEPGALLAVLERSCSFTSSLADDTTRRVVGAIGKLPSLPSTCASLTRALQDPDVSLDEVGRIVELDVGMTAKVLQLVNSAFFHLVREVTSVRGAVGVLGLDTLKQLVLTVEIFRTFRLARRIPGFCLDEFERHSHFAARMAALLPVSEAASSSAIVAALLHDVGKLILATRLPDPFELALRTSLKEGRPLHEVEKELTGTGHAEIGAYLLGLWGLPAVVVDAVGRHHQPPPAARPVQELDTLGATHIADALALEVERDRSRGGAPGCNLLDDVYVASLGLADRVPAWRKLAAEAWTDGAADRPDNILTQSPVPS